jgi:hypothetical protein
MKNMNKETKIILPEEFLQMCDFMDVSPEALLERFARNILCYEDVEDPDGAEITLAMRYFLTYSANRNRIYERQVYIRESFIDKTIAKIKSYLLDLNQNGSVSLDTDLQEFIADWKAKWKNVNGVWHSERGNIASGEVPGKPQGQDKFIEARDLRPFESIGVNTFADVVLQKGHKESVRIESREDVAHIVQTIVEDKRLSISTKNDSFNVIPHAIIYITYSTLNGLVVEHAGNVTCMEPIESNWLGIVQNGKGNIDLQVDVISLDATLTKSGGLRLSGSADEAKILNTGPGSFDGIDLETSEAKVTMKDSGGISICVEDELSAFLEGTGNLLLKGEPRLKSFVMPK